MPVFELQDPATGKTFEVEAPDVQSAVGAFKQFTPQQQPEMSLGEVAGDVAKSAGIGVVQGGIGLATLPGNIEALGRAGINAGAGLVGAQPPVSPETYLPTYSDWKGAIEERTGEFYKPKTTVGEYARTLGEFAPLAVGGPASVASKATRVALPAVVSESAGQVTEGTDLEPWARMGGALLGGLLPNTAARTVTPAPANAARQTAVQTLENEGVTALTAGQRTGNARVRQVEDATSLFPGGGGRAAAMQERASLQFTRAALKKAGVNADRADGPVIDQAFTDLGNRFNALTARNDMVQSKRLVSDLNKVLADYNAVTAAPFRSPIVKETIDQFVNRQSMARGAYIPGAVYQSTRSRLGKLVPNLKQSDPNAMIAVREIMDALDRGMEFSIRLKNPRDLGAFREARGQYRNLLAIEDAVASAGEAAASGLITPAALARATKKQGKRAYVRGKGDLGPLARAGVETLTPLKSSGTAERSFAQQMVSAPASAASSLAAGAMTGFDPLMMAAAASPYLISAATARGLMSGPAQRYLANQRIPQNVPRVPMLPDPGQVGLLPLAATQFNAGLLGDR